MGRSQHVLSDRRAGTAEIAEAARLIRVGEIIAFPTETVYGLGADADNSTAVRRVFALKGRPLGHPLIVHVEDEATARSYVRDFPSAAVRLARAFWPGPLTMVLQKSARASDVATGGHGSIAMRVPAHPVARMLLKHVASGIAAPSANHFGRVSPTTAAHVREDFGDDAPFILDGGPCSIGVESTIVDVRGARVELLRPGAITHAALAAALGREVRAASGPVPSPGTLPSHYAPRSPVEVIRGDEVSHAVARAIGKNLVILAPDNVAIPSGIAHIPLGPTARTAAHRLYGALRAADALGDFIMVVPPSLVGVGAAVFDRLLKASAAR